MLSCVTRNQIFQCSLLPLSLMCECWIIEFTARCLMRCGTQESSGVSAFTPARGDKCLSFQKVYHWVINKNQQWWKILACFGTLIKYVCASDCYSSVISYVGTVTFKLIPGDNPIITHFSLAKFVKGVSVCLKPIIHKRYHTFCIQYYVPQGLFSIWLLHTVFIAHKCKRVHEITSEEFPFPESIYNFCTNKSEMQCI